MTPLERTVDWLCTTLSGMPSDIRMVYIDSGEYVTPAPDNKTVARYDLFGFNSIPAGGFDPENDDHVADLGCWDWEASPNCEFPDVPFEAYNWLEVLESAARHPSVAHSMRRRAVLLLFADHDGPVTVVRQLCLKKISDIEGSRTSWNLRFLIRGFQLEVLASGSPLAKAEFELDGVFWHSDVGFVVDKHRMPSTFPDGTSFARVSLDSLLVESKQLPNLRPAPIASWLLARLMQLTTEGLGFEANDKLYNDGGGYYLNLIAFSRSMTPLSFFNVHGTSAACKCWGQTAPALSPAELMQTFVDALTANVHDLMQCKALCFDTDPPDLDKRRIGKPSVFGWDGKAFLGFTAKRD